MPNKLYFNSQNGMTLVELLAAITILAVLFIGFLSIFPQMTKSNMQTEEKLETMNLAKIELVELKEGKLEKLHVLDPEPEIISNDEITRFRYEKEGYQYIVDYYIDHDLESDGHPKSVQLNKIHIKVNKSDNLISETFGYLKYSG